VIANARDRYVLPAGFDGPGVWAFKNTDNEPHDGVILRLPPGGHASDIVAWAKAGEGRRTPDHRGDRSARPDRRNTPCLLGRKQTSA
jgi:hypothetical protein